MKKTGFLSGIGQRALTVFVLVAFIALALACTSNVPAPVIDRSVSSGRAPDASAPNVPNANTHVVKPGDTLYSIAREYGIDHRELITLNNIENPDQIAIGWTLKIRPTPSTAPSSEAVVVHPVGETQVARSPGPEGIRVKREPKAGKEPYSLQALTAAQNQEAPKPVELAPPPVRPVETPPQPTFRPPQPVGGLSWAWPAGGKLVGTFSGKGIEIDGKAGDPIFAAANGRVVYSGTGLRGYGKLVIVKHNAAFLSAYAHNRNILVAEGQSVAKGQRIAEMGNTDADRVKLHFEIRRDGAPVDPLKYLPSR